MQILGYTNIQSIAEKNEMAKMDSLGWFLQGRGEDGGKQGVHKDGRPRASLYAPIFTESLTRLGRVDFLSILYWGDGGFQGSCMSLLKAPGFWSGIAPCL